MTIDINELRRLAQEATPGPWKIVPVGDGRQKFAVADSEFHSILTVTDEGGATFGTVYNDADAKFIAAANQASISEILDRLEAAEKSDAESIAMYRKARDERDALRALVVMRFDHDRPPQFTQGYDTHELTEPVTAEHCRWFVDEIERLRAKLEAAEKERDALRAAVRHEADCVEAAKTEIKALRAKVAEMEQQEPSRLVTPTAYRWRYRGAIKWQYGELTEETVRLAKEHNHEVQPLGVLPGAQQCKNCNGMGDRFDQSGEKIPCDLCESHLEEIRSLVTEAVHDIISGSDFWLSISLAAKKIYALPGAKGEEK